jgi:hypothetical protein
MREVTETPWSPEPTQTCHSNSFVLCHFGDERFDVLVSFLCQDNLVGPPEGTEQMETLECGSECRSLGKGLAPDSQSPHPSLSYLLFYENLSSTFCLDSSFDGFCCSQA